MIVDFHTHLFPPDVVADRTAACAADPYCALLYGDPKARMATAEDLLAAMDRDGVAVSVIANFGWSDTAWCRRTNDYLLDVAARSNGRLIPFAGIVPRDVEWSLREMERVSAAGARGIGELMPDGQGVAFDDHDVLGPIWSAAAALDLVVLTHASEPVGHSYAGKGSVYPRALLDTAQRFPGTRFVMAHLGGGLPFYGYMPEVRAAIRNNVWFDLAATPFLYLAEAIGAAVRAVGEDRILFATDYPLLPAQRCLRELRAAGWDSAALLGDNARALLRL